MFYEESTIKKFLACEKCKERYDEPRVLPCGSIICNFCCKQLNINNNKQFKCSLCEENHSLSSNGFPINKYLAGLMSLEPCQVSRGKTFEKLRTNAKEIESQLDKLKFCINNTSDVVNEYCSNLENELQLSKEENLLLIEKQYQEMLDDIQQYKNECIHKLNSKLKEDYFNETFGSTVKELFTHLDESNKHLAEKTFDEDEIVKKNEIGSDLIKKANDQIRKLDESIFSDRYLVFHKNVKCSLDFKLGLLDYNPYSILSKKQAVDLFNLCSFEPNSELRLIYRASRDGFSASDFHSKCDAYKKTLVVVKSTNGNIFGGYTEQDWSGNHTFKNDSNAFIFSLINSDNKLIYIKTSNPTNSMYCRPDYGPIFGNDDFYLHNDSNTNELSYSNLGGAYKHPEYKFCSNEANCFLAGSQYFSTLDIEVYSKNLISK